MRMTLPMIGILSVLLFACAEKPAPQPATVQDQAGPGASSPAPTNESGSIVSNESGNAETDPQQMEQQARLSAAQSYLEAATDSARKVYEQSMRNCQTLQASDRADCENSAVASEEAELRAARVEFDRRMSEGQ